jgi:hypothetical protein
MKKRLSSLLAAAVLTVVILAVFSTLRDYGPEATVRRFHQAAVDSNFRNIERLSTHAENSNTAVMLAQKVATLAAKGASIRVKRVDRTQNGRVVAEFLYLLPGKTEVLYWVVKRESRGWVVDTDEMAAYRFAPRLGFNQKKNE